MQYCPKCGGEIRGAMNFCPYCGAAQPNHTMPQVQMNQHMMMQQPQQQNINEQKPSQKMGLSYLLGLIFCLILQPIGFIMALFGYFRAKSQQNETNKTLAKAGIIVSIVEVILFILSCIFFVVVCLEIAKHYPEVNGY